MDPNIHGTLKPRGGRSRKPSVQVLQVKIAKITEKFDGDTQRLRHELLIDLKTLSEIANQKAAETTHPQQHKQRIEWIRISAYISQVINSIAKTYDVTQIKTELQQLRQKIEEINKNEHS